MNRKFHYIALASVLLMLGAIFNPSPAVAQTEAISVAEFREKFTAYAIWLDSNTSSNQNLAMQVQAMSAEEFQYLYDSFADPDAFIAVTEQIMMPAVENQLAPNLNLLAPQSTPFTTTLFLPAYPSGSVYQTWVATLPGLGLLSDSDGDGSLANERCSDDGEAGIGIAAGTLTAAAIIGDVACNSIVVILGEGTNLPACVAAGILHEAENANNIVSNQCSSQGGSVDSAEIEATFENSKIISSQISTHDVEIKDILAANHAEVMDALARNQAQLLKIEIEKELSVASDNKRLSYFYLPQAQSGLLEVVRQTVLDTITANQSAGMSIGNAQSWFNKAEASLAKGSYKTAYDLYKKAYLEAVK